MSLELELGEGATKAFRDAITIDDNTTVVYTNWQHESKPITMLESGVVVTQHLDSEIIWPGDGVWRLATVLWPDGLSQQVFFQNQNIHWGIGLCADKGGETGDSLKRLASPKMKQFLATYINSMKIQLPNLPSFYNRFLLAGFEIDQQTESQVIVTATLKDPNSRMAKLFNWRIAGSASEDEPDWRTQIREEMGLETLFPND